MKNKTLSAAALALFFTTLISCSKAPPAEETPKLPSESPPISTQIKVEGEIFTISKEVLGKPFLLQASLISEPGFGLYAPNWSGLQSQVVFFQQKGNSLFLMKSPKGQVVSEEVGADFILAEFPLLPGSTPDHPKIDFNAGMSKIFVNWDWYISDYEGDWVPPQSAFPVTHSFIEAATSDEQRITVRQTVQFFDELWLVSIPLKVVYYLKSYQPDADFKPTLTPGFDKVGYFEIAPTVEPDFGYTNIYISKWNAAKPITFHYSANTPKEFEEALKQGVLYWNKAFGKEVVKVEKAPEGVTAPNPDYNMIQWLTYHDAPFAYADAQMDPLTGQILHAQIFLPSAHSYFAQHVRFPRYFRQLKQPEQREEKAKTKEENGEGLGAKRLGLRGFKSGRLCEFDVLEAMAEGAEGVIPEEQALQAAQDVVRRVVAHEVGHTLGLRHNFAGSTAAEWSLKEAQAAVRKYFLEGTAPQPKIVTSSVMEYGIFESRILAGEFIKNSDQALPYDQVAIEWAYQTPDADLSTLASPPFCTDSGVWNYNDCLRFDFGANPLADNSQWFVQQLKLTPSIVAEYFLSFKTDFNPRNRKPVKGVKPQIRLIAESIVYPLFDLTQWLGIHSRSLRVAEEKMDEWLNQRITEAGGLEQTLAFLNNPGLPEKTEQFIEQFTKYIEQPEYRKGKRWDGEPYEVTDEEIKYMKEIAPALFAELQDALAETISDVLTWVSQYRSVKEVEVLEAILADWTRHVLLGPYTQQTRWQATEVLSPARGPYLDWEEKYRCSIAKELEKKLETELGKPIREIDPRSLPREKQKWFLTELQILGQISCFSQIKPADEPQPPVVD